MEEWKECKLGEFFELHRGYDLTKSEIKEGPYPVVCSTSIMGYHNEYKVKAPGVVIGRSGTLGEVQFIDTDYWPHNTSLYVSDFKGNSPKFIKYFLQLFGTGNVGGGSAVPTLNRNHLQALTVRVPPLPTQQKIAAILSSLDNKIELNNKINTNLERQAQDLFKNFSEKSSKSVKFTDLIYILGGGTPKTNNEDYWNGKIPFFTPKDVGNPYCLLTEKKITESGLDNCNSRLYPVNTIFVTARGTVGKVCLAGLPMAMNQSCYALKSKDDNQLLAYFYTLEAINSLKHKANGATFDAIVTRDFETETINILSEQDAKEFNQIVKPIFEKILTNQKENINLSNLRDTLLPKLMNGEINEEIKPIFY